MVHSAGGGSESAGRALQLVWRHTATAATWVVTTSTHLA
jgi:hypothetical protein